MTTASRSSGSISTLPNGMTDVRRMPPRAKQRSLLFDGASNRRIASRSGRRGHGPTSSAPMAGSLR